MSMNRKLLAGFSLLTLVPLLMTLVAWRNSWHLVVASRDVAETNELVKQMENFLSRLKDVEVAEREYVLTGDEASVAQFVDARRDIESRLAKLPVVRADAHWLELLRTLVPQKFDEIQKTIELRRSGDLAAASEMVMSHRADRPMDGIRRVVMRMMAEEDELLTKRSAVQNGRLVDTMILFSIVLVLNVALIWSLFYFVRRESSEVQRMNEELESRVEERTLQLQKSNEELQKFAYVASHDLKEPMRMISSYAALLQRRFQGQLGGDADTWIGFIKDGVTRMNALITDLLDYSRAGELTEDQKQIVDTEAVLATVLTNLEVTIREAGATVTHDPLPRLLYEPVRLGQLLQNLIGNALKYRSERLPIVHISAASRMLEIEFAVQDNGIGIPPEYREQIFGIFQRLHGKDIEGTGIGLATCRKIVEEHDGRIWVESEPGVGSTFRFTVPASQSAAHVAAGS
ncbi:MAG: CHASE3 domain-containing protein [Bryobacteraceae bacterium]|nr:CHASE3 domain-containing protein [Bryobacteraceae bacterium]